MQKFRQKLKQDQQRNEEHICRGTNIYGNLLSRADPGAARAWQRDGCRMELEAYAASLIRREVDICHYEKTC